MVSKGDTRFDHDSDGREQRVPGVYVCLGVGGWVGVGVGDGREHVPCVMIYEIPGSHISYLLYTYIIYTYIYTHIKHIHT